MTDAPDDLELPGEQSPETPYEPPTADVAPAPALPAGTILTAQHVREKTFSSTRFKPGYDEDEVDAFLDEVELTLIQLHQEIAVLRQQLAAGGIPPASTPLPAPTPTPTPPPVALPPAGAAAGTNEMEEMLRRTLLLAQKTADQAVAEAREQADQTLMEARVEATRVVADARGRAEAAEREAAARSTAMLSESDAQRRSIEAKVEALRSFEREYRSRLRGYFELQLRELEGVGGGTSTAAPTASSDAAKEPSEPPAPGVAPSGAFIPADPSSGGPQDASSTTVVPSAPPVPGVSGVPVPRPIAAPAAAGVEDPSVADGEH